LINKDYILRLAERLGRELAILLGLGKREKYQEALIYIDDLLLRMSGFTSRSINALSEDLLVKALSPLGILNAEACLWIATMLKAEGQIYEDQANINESYYRYLKSLHLFLTALQHEPIEDHRLFSTEIGELVVKLEDYELPPHLKKQLFRYYEYSGQYAKAEDTLFELLEQSPANQEIPAQGLAFYERLLVKSDADLQMGHFSRSEVDEGIAHLQRYQN
jgi:tetratricopeptide (TPR) repeat protein